MGATNGLHAGFGKAKVKDFTRGDQLFDGTGDLFGMMALVS